MNPIEYWRLSTSLSIVQATLLFCGLDPSDVEYEVERDRRYQPPGYIAIRNSLVSAVRDRKLEANIEYVDTGFGQSSEIDVRATTIDCAQLDAFFDASPVPGYFFGRWASAAGAQANAQMPPKLDAAIQAWKAVTSDPLLTRGKSPKQALNAWLVEHAAQFGLINGRGEINRTGIEEICKVANWRPEGGATPTPGPLPPQIIQPPRSRDDFFDGIDDEVPF